MSIEVAGSCIKTGPWYRDLTPYQWKVFIATYLGWMLDSFDLVLYTFVIGALIADWHIDLATAGLLMSATLIATGVGFIAFGAIADRYGRVRGMTWCILLFGLTTGLSGFAQNPWQMAILRLLSGFALGGEWTCGAAMMTETWSSEHRGKISGLMQSGYGVGYMLAAAVGAIVVPMWGWRPVFFIGVLPALFAAWVRKHLKEPEAWVEMVKQFDKKGKGSAGGQYKSLVRKGVFGLLVQATILMCLVNAGYWGLFTWMPSFLAAPLDKGGAGLSMIKSLPWLLGVQAGAIVGFICAGFISDRIGRRYAFGFYCLGAAIMVPIFAYVRDPFALTIICPLLGAFSVGYAGLYGVYLGELFPTAVRSTAQGIAYGVGRAFAVITPPTIGVIAMSYGFRAGLLFSSGVFLLALIWVLLMPETRGKALETV